MDYTHSFGSGERTTPQLDCWRLTPLPDDFDIPPANAPNPSAERLHNGFFSGESASKLRRAASTVGYLSLGVDTSEEALAVFRRYVSDAVYLNNIDTTNQHFIPLRR